MTKATQPRSPDVVEIDFSRPVKLKGNRVGRLVGWSADGPLVDHASNPHGPITARTTVPLDATTAQAAIDSEQEVLLVFEAERSDRPIIVGLLQEPCGRESRVEVKSEPSSSKLDAHIDGKRVVLEGQDEVVLRCGQASITLRRNGRIVVRGAYVETRAKGVNRIKGGSVQIN